MSETAKTITFVAAAAVVGLVAYLSRPSPPAPSAEGMVGKELFPDFTDPLAAASLEILEFDEDTASVRPFKVAQVGGRWSIPSHDNYPTDAKDQLADAAAGLMGLEVLGVASESPGDHPLYGVVDPDPDKLSAGATGVGTRVTMKDGADKTLLSLVIGKEVPDRRGLRYVRRTGQDPVYTVAVKTDKISTDFEDWIEEDLLKLSSWDIDKIEIRDYSIDELAGTLNMRSRLTLDYNDTGDPKWELAEDLVFARQRQDWQPNPRPMSDKEELDTEKLDDMRRALDDLKIVDVAKKPAGLSEDLRNLQGAETFLNNREAVLSLQDCGFYPMRWQDNLELVSNQGEIHAVTDEGVRYILRFGNIAGSGKAGKKGEGDAAADDAGTDQGEADEAETDEAGDSDGGVNRFLFVMAEFDPDVFEKPELEPLPEKPAAAEAAEAEQEDAEGEKKDETPADEDASDAASADAANTGGDKAEASETAAEEEPQVGDEKSEKMKEYEAEVEWVEKENKRKQEEYDEKINKGREKVKELNDRFADWYYVISNDVYQKIHLSRDDIVKQKEKEEEEEKDEAAESSTTDEASPAAESPAGETAEPSAEDAPAEMSAEEKPDDEPPAEEKAAEESPAEESAAEEKPADREPAAESPN